jgi:hypothetical protein
MASVLPLVFVVLAGFCLCVVLFSLWQSLRLVLARDQGTSAASSPQHAGRAALLVEKNALLGAIREARSEHELGKLSLEDAEQLEQRYRVRAREVLRDLDQQLGPYRDRARAMLEEALSKPDARTQSTASAPKSSGAACPSCRAANDADAVFCKKCGARISSGAST